MSARLGAQPSHGCRILQYDTGPCGGDDAVVPSYVQSIWNLFAEELRANPKILVLCLHLIRQVLAVQRRTRQH